MPIFKDDDDRAYAAALALIGVSAAACGAIKTCRMIDMTEHPAMKMVAFLAACDVLMNVKHRLDPGVVDVVEVIRDAAYGDGLHIDLLESMEALCDPYYKQMGDITEGCITSDPEETTSNLLADGKLDACLNALPLMIKVNTCEHTLIMVMTLVSIAMADDAVQFSNLCADDKTPSIDREQKIAEMLYETEKCAVASFMRLAERVGDSTEVAECPAE